MEKSLTLFDVLTYQFEVEALQKEGSPNDIKPGKQVVQNVLNYARALSVVHTRSAGNALFLMN
jgi:hypothetical protein